MPLRRHPHAHVHPQRLGFAPAINPLRARAPHQQAAIPILHGDGVARIARHDREAGQPAQRLFRPPAFGDVLQKNHELPAIDGTKLEADFDVKNTPVLAAMAGLKPSPLTPEASLDVVGGGLRGFGGLQVRDALGEQFWHTVTAHHAIGLVDLQQPAIAVHQPKTGRGRLEDGPALLLALPQRRIHQPALGDIAQHEAEGRRATFVFRRRGRHMHPDGRAIVMDNPQLARQRFGDQPGAARMGGMEFLALQVEWVDVVGVDKTGDRLLDERSPRRTQQGGGAEVRLQNQPRLADGAITRRR